MPRPRGRPPTIDIAELEKLCHLQCTYEEIAAYFRVTKRAVEKAATKPEYREVMDRGRNSGLISLRRSQFKSAIDGNVTMQIWLGKQLLGQRDEIHTSHDGSLGLHDDSARALLESKLARLVPENAGTDPERTVQVQ